MEENTEQITEETIEEITETKCEKLPWNRLDEYIPVEFQNIDYQRSWKKCHCGRQTWLYDNWCPACGQKLGMPEKYYEINN